MSSLSLNWKRLSLKIKNVDVGSASSQSHKRINTTKLKGRVSKGNKDANSPKRTLVKSATALTGAVQKARDAKRSDSQAKVEAKKVEEIQTSDPRPLAVSPMEYVLWTYGEELKLSHVAKAVGSTSLTITPDARKQEAGKYIAMDCEFVGIGIEGKESALARASIVNYHGHTIYDKYVKPEEPVTDWRTWVSGVAPYHMHDAVLFKQAQEEIAKILDGRILVGHSIKNDLDALLLSHPKMSIRDTSRYPPFRELSKGRSPALKKLAAEILNIEIQGASHSSVEDSNATMLLFRLHRRDFEKRLGVVNRRPTVSPQVLN